MPKPLRGRLVAQREAVVVIAARPGHALAMVCLRLFAAVSLLAADTAAQQLTSLEQPWAWPVLSDGRGDPVNTTYLGMNWFLRGHELKLLGGVEYTDLDGGDAGGGYANWSFYMAVRTLF